MRRILSFIIMGSVKCFAWIFYRTRITWFNDIPWEQIKLIVILNHTSLYEPIFLGAVPWKFVWRLSNSLVGPGADKTLNRPIVGIFWRLLSGKGMVAISRKRDGTWLEFLRAMAGEDTVIAIAPEGRMKRSTGLDKDGKPMTVKSGVADVLELLEDGHMVFVYSGGLHHVQHPGELIPRLFKTIKVGVESMNISEYKKTFPETGTDWKRAVVKDMQHRLETKCPK